MRTTEKPSLKLFTSHTSEAKSNINLKDAYGRTRLHVAAFGGPDAEKKVQALLDEDSDPNLLDQMGHTPFHNACYGQANILVIKCFLKNSKLNLNVKTSKGRNFLHFAANGCHVNSAEELDILPLLLLHYKETHNSEEFEKMLNLADCEGLTPLHLTCMTGCQTTPSRRIAAIHTLLKSGAKIKLDNYGRTPMDLAKAYRLEELEKILAALGATETAVMEKIKLEVSPNF